MAEQEDTPHTTAALIEQAPNGGFSVSSYGFMGQGGVLAAVSTKQELLAWLDENLTEGGGE